MEQTRDAATRILQERGSSTAAELAASIGVSTGSIRRFLNNNRSNFDPRKYLAESQKAMREIVVSRYEAFGTAGHASKIKPISLEAMSDRYLAGELDRN